MGEDMFPYNGIEKNKMRLIRSVAVTVTMMMMLINRKEK
jgi:hypothetical protein